MPRRFLPIAVLLPLILSGCSVVMAPVKLAGTMVETAVDATTQTQSEKEEDIGRRALQQRKQQREECIAQADDKQQRKACEEQYSDDI